MGGWVRHYLGFITFGWRAKHQASIEQQAEARSCPDLQAAEHFARDSMEIAKSGFSEMPPDVNLRQNQMMFNLNYFEFNDRERY